VCIVALLAACVVGAWTALACHRARGGGTLPRADALVWAGLASVFLMLLQAELLGRGRLLKGLGEWLRALARESGWYANRRWFQIVASVAVALVVLALLLWGLHWVWHFVKRYRLAIGFASLAVGFGMVNFISLHEVDAWNAAMPWARSAVEVVAAAGALAVAIVRLRDLGEFERLWPSGRGARTKSSSSVLWLS
jgi:hypothetical protein